MRIIVDMDTTDTNDVVPIIGALEHILSLSTVSHIIFLETEYI